jgi:predicted phage terminase large subunit-like protein
MRLLFGAYGASLAEKSSREVRNIIASERYQAVFGELSSVEAPVKLADDSHSVSAWDLNAPHRGGMVAVGIGGGIFGHGAHLAIIDDPFASREKSESELQRDTVWRWWSSVRTRLEEGAAVVLMHQRLHPGDLAGRLLQSMHEDPLADQWTVLCLPALAQGPDERAADEAERAQKLDDGLFLNIEDPLGRQPGEPLWPEKYPVDVLGGIKATLDKVDPRDWPALYQQMPREIDGDWFKREHLKLIDFLPDTPRPRVRYWDKAATLGGGCYTAGVLISRDVSSGEIFVEDVVRGQWAGDQRDSIILQTARLDAEQHGNRVIVWHEQEPGSGGKDSAVLLNRKLAGFPVHADKVTGSKDGRMGGLAAQAQAGNVRIKRAPWNAAYIDELCALPHGKYRDQADASSGAFNKLVMRNTKKVGSRQG